MAEMVTRQELIDAKRDARDLGKAVNEKVIVSPRYGEDFKSIPLIVEEGNQEIINLQNAIDIAAAAGAGANGWTAQLIADESGKTQQQINNNIAVKILRAAEIGLVSWNNPDKMPPYTQQEYEQAYNNGIRLAQAVVDSSNKGYTQAVLETGNYPFVYPNLTGSTDFNKVLTTGSADIRGVTNFTLDFNKSTIFTIFDSNNKNPYDTSPASFLPYQLPGALFTVYDSRGLTFKNGVLKGDQYKRSWVAGENTREQTYGMVFQTNNRNIRFENMKFTGFRGDGVQGKPRGTVLENTTLHEWSKGDIDASGTIVELAGAYSSARVDLRTKTIIDNRVQLETHAARLLAFRNNLLKVSFFKADNSLISQETTAQSLDITLPKGCAFIQFTAFNDERTTDTVTYSTSQYSTTLATGVSKGFYFDERCEFYENHRGGVSNLGGDSFFFGSKFRDMGQLSKLGFPHYGDPTQYAINFEDSYTSSLTVDGIRVDNVTQGVLSNSRELTVRNSKFFGMIHGGVNNYSCVKGIIEGNTFAGFSRAIVGAISVSRDYNHAQSVCNISNNILLDVSMLLNLSDKPNMQVNLSNNTCIGGQWILRGDGSNISSTNNTIKNARGIGVNNPALCQDGLLESSGNKLIGTSLSTSQVFIEFNSLSGTNNTLFIEGNSRFNLGNTGNDTLTKYMDNVELRSKLGVSRLTLSTDRLTTEKTLDKWSIDEVVFDGVILGTSLYSAQDLRSTIIDISNSTFKNGAFIEISKNELGNAGSTIVVVKNCYIDVSSSSQVIRNGYTTKGVREFVFINCTFFSNTDKTLPIVTAPTLDAGAAVTSRAIKCNFVNVTNSDSFTVIS